MNPPEYGTPSEETSVTVPGQYDTAMYSFVKNHQHNLQRIKQNVLMEIQVIGILHQTQTRLVVNNISLISAQAQESQSYTNKQVERALRELTAHLTLLNNMLDDHASLRSILQRTLSNTQQVRARTPGSHTHTGIDVKAYMPATPERRFSAQDFRYRGHLDDLSRTKNVIGCTRSAAPMGENGSVIEK
ncbi:hypothetical protein MMC14_009568 [Varicellaria rhodocarpa]|nr:hypothetical protein [Varicellaria rhodocarpa]